MAADAHAVPSGRLVVSRFTDSRMTVFTAPARWQAQDTPVPKPSKIEFFQRLLVSLALIRTHVAAGSFRSPGTPLAALVSLQKGSSEITAARGIARVECRAPCL